MGKIRKRLNQYEAKALGLEPKPHEGGRTQARYYITEGQWDKVLDARHAGINGAFQETSINPADAPHLWVKSDKASVFVKNPLYEYSQEAKEIDFSVIKDYVEPSKIEVSPVAFMDFDRLVFSDVHVGMDVNPDGNSPYDYKWNEKELSRRMVLMAKHVLKHRKSPVLYIDDLGDFMDGFNGFTTRGGHKLPQNMTNQEAFKNGFEFKVGLIDLLAEHYESIQLSNVCQDNHSGDFGFFVNESVRVYLESKYTHVKVVNITKFMDYYRHGKRVFVLCHGKDSTNMFKPFPVVVNDKTEKIIDAWLKSQGLLGKGYEIEFSKGDNHQWMIDRTSAKWFKYCCYPSLAPPSQWVQANFGESVSGFSFTSYGEEVIEANKTIS